MNEREKKLRCKLEGCDFFKWYKVFEWGDIYCRKCYYCGKKEYYSKPPNLYIKFPNILASIYAQKRLSEVYNIKPLCNEYIEKRIIVIVSPPCEYQKDNPVICGVDDEDEEKLKDKILDWRMGLSLISMVNKKIIKEEEMKKYYEIVDNKCLRSFLGFWKYYYRKIFKKL